MHQINGTQRQRWTSLENVVNYCYSANNISIRVCRVILMPLGKRESLLTEGIQNLLFKYNKVDEYSYWGWMKNEEEENSRFVFGNFHIIGKNLTLDFMEMEYDVWAQTAYKQQWFEMIDFRKEKVLL